jgi:hypothetical protein
MKNTTLNFCEVHKKRGRTKNTIKNTFTVNLKHKYILFPAAYIEQNKLQGKMLKWYIDSEKNAIGWKLLNENRELLINMNDYHYIKANKQRQYKFQIGSALSKLTLKHADKRHTGLEMNSYSCQYNGKYGGIIHYVILTDK